MDASQLDRLARRIHPRLRAMIPRPLKNRLRQLGALAVGRSVQEGQACGRVVLYSRRPQEFPGYAPRATLQPGAGTAVGVALIATVRNERENTEAWLEDLARQERPPDQVVIVDAASEDGTWEILQRFASTSRIPIELIREPGANIARGRNLAIGKADQPVIACTDFGCRLSPAWLVNLAAPFEADRSTEVVAGWYTARLGNRWAQILADSLIPALGQIDPATFLPSARSLAFTKDAWRRAGGFPEWLTQFGEDTYFAIQLKRASRNWAFVPEASVEWFPPGDLRQTWRKLVDWSSGDGESGILDSAYLWRRGRLRSIAALGAAIVVGAVVLYGLFPKLGPLIGIVGVLCLTGAIGRMSTRRRQGLRRMLITLVGQIPRELGYRRGRKRRPSAFARRYAGTRGVAFILAGVPMDDTGGGSRGAQIATEFLRRQMMVVYLYGFPRQESVDLGITLNHPHLLHLPTSEFDPEAFGRDFSEVLTDKPSFCLVEFPLREYRDLARAIRRWNGRIIYDLIDDWSTSLGGSWYDPGIERSLIELSDLLTATAPVLGDRMRATSGRDVLLLPNAANLRLFDPSRDWERPPDLPAGKPVLIYVGALWGAWFDWDLLAFLAQSLPRAAVVVIGDYRGQCASRPPNLHFLGLKPQSHLPAYLAHADVGILPWKASTITQATSPLKIYEYLAMGKPVIAPRLDPLRNVPHILFADSHEEFLSKVRQAQPLHLDEKRLKDFLAANSWESRVDTLSHALEGLKSGERGESQDAP